MAPPRRGVLPQCQLRIPEVVEGACELGPVLGLCTAVEAPASLEAPLRRLDLTKFFCASPRLLREAAISAWPSGRILVRMERAASWLFFAAAYSRRMSCTIPRSL